MSHQEEIFIVEESVMSLDKKRTGYTRRGFTSGSAAFAFAHKFINANSEGNKWEYDYDSMFTDTITIKGKGMFHISHETDKKEEGTVEIMISKLNLVMDDPKKEDKPAEKKTNNSGYFSYPKGDDECLWDADHTAKKCHACKYRLECGEYANKFNEKFIDANSEGSKWEYECKKRFKELMSLLRK